MTSDLAASGRTDDPPLVLVVDDEPAVLGVVTAGLRVHGFRVRPVGDGPAALDVYRRDPAEVAAVLLDVRMPGQDGPGVLTALRAINPDVRAYFMTGDPGAYTENELLSAGARRVFRKPLNLAALAAGLRRELDLGRVPVAT